MDTSETQPRFSTDGTIMVDARYVCDHTSGIGRYTENLIQQLLKIDDSVRLRLICDPSKPTAGLDANDDGVKGRVDFQTYPAEPNSLRTRFKMASSIDMAGVDVFHSPFNILPRRLAPKAMFTLHDIMWLLDADFCTDSKWRKVVTGTFYKQLIPRSVAEAERIMTVSHYSKDAIEDYFPEMKGRVHVSYNAVDPYFHPITPEDGWPLIETILPRDSRFVLIVGQGSPYKNHTRAVAAFQEAFGDRDDVHLVLVRRLSRGPATEMHELLANPAFAGRIHSLQHVTGDQLRALYSLADSFLFPSLYEGFGLPSLEAMACGTPVVTSNIGAPSEVGGNAAIKVDPKDVSAIAGGLRQLYDDPELHTERRDRGLARAAEFTWNRCAEDTLRVYRALLGEA